MPGQQNDKFWDLIVKRIEEEKCILILGPDIDISEKDKSINKLVKDFFDSKATKYNFYSEDEFFSFTDVKQKEYALMEIQEFYSQLSANKIHQLICDIPFHLIINLSPDLVLKNLFDARKLSYSFDFFNKEQNPQTIENPTSEKPLIYNLFGNINVEGSVILTYNDLFDYLISIFSKFELPKDLKTQILTARLVLFLGFQFEKWYFKLILRLLNLQEGKVNHASLKDRKILPQIKNFYSEEFKIEFLEYNGIEILELIRDRFKDKNMLRTKTEITEKPEIFISYAWGGESDYVVDLIYTTLKNNEYNIIRDKINLGYKGNIKQFMQSIGKGKFIIVVISDRYLKSANCMFEMLEIKKSGNVYDRIFPVVLEDAKIYDEITRIDYINYWDESIQELKDKIKTIRDPVGIGHVIEKIDQYNDIRRIIDEITDLLRDMNTLDPSTHKNNNFGSLTGAIDKKIQSEKIDSHANI